MDSKERISIPYFYLGEFRRRRADGDFANYGTEVQIGEWRIAAASETKMNHRSQ